MNIKVDFKKSHTKTRSDKKVRVNITTTQDTHNKLKKLAIACDKSKTGMAEELIKMCVNHEEIINWYQKQYNVEEQYRVIPVKRKDKIIY